jgi:hypothetical protein
MPLDISKKSIAIYIVISAIGSALLLYGISNEPVATRTFASPSLALLPTVAPAPTQPPSLCEQALAEAGLDPSSYTLGELIDKLGPPDRSRAFPFSTHGGGMAFQFLYLDRGVYFFTEYIQANKIERAVRLSSCEQYDPIEDRGWPDGNNWPGFAEDR